MQESSFSEHIITIVIKATGYSAIVLMVMIFVFLLIEGAPTLVNVPPQNLLQFRWYPIEDHYGLLPLIGGTILVTIGAALVAVPLGLATAIYIAEIAPRTTREFLKPIVEILAGLPSVLLGFLGILILSKLIFQTMNVPTGLTAFTGAILLGMMAVPTIVSVAEDALDAVPKTYRNASLAMGATKWQTIWRVTLPAAKSGVLTAIMLGIVKNGLNLLGVPDFYQRLAIGLILLIALSINSLNILIMERKKV